MVTTDCYVVGNFSPMAKRIGGNRKAPQRHFLKEWRLFRGMTGEEMAELADTTKASVSRIENKLQRLTEEAAKEFADILVTHPDILKSRPPNENDRLPPVPQPSGVTRISRRR